MKTIKQIADELGVSKQKVYRFIVRNHITASSEVKQSKLYDEATEMLIKQGILEDEPYQKSHHEAHQNHINDTVSEAVIELLRKEMEQKNEQLQEKDRQIREKDQQISEMQAQLSMNQKLMDQEQQLHMLTLPTAKAGGFLLQPLLHWLIPFGISMSYTVSTS